jgi:hypothetical protein
MTKKIVRPLNALKSGAYARGDTILPWESAAEFETLRAEIFDDLQPQRKLERDTASNIVENSWQRERLRRTTAIATHRHAFGRKLEESGAESWPDALEVVRRHDVERHDALQRIAQSAWNGRLARSDYFAREFFYRIRNFRGPVRGSFRSFVKTSLNLRLP